MKRVLVLIVSIIVLLLMSACEGIINPYDIIKEEPQDPDVLTVTEDFDPNPEVGEAGTVTIGTYDFSMVRTTPGPNIVFPLNSGAVNPTGILETHFYMADMEMTNEIFVLVYQWAYDNGKFSDDPADANGIDSTICKHGGQELLDVESYYRFIVFSDGVFSIKENYVNRPVTNVSMYGAIMFCNWMTEIRDGNTDNLVYTGIDEDWLLEETISDSAKTGYRLPTYEEHKWAASYYGATIPTYGDLVDDYISSTHNVGFYSGITAGYVWAPHDYASGATADTSDFSACASVAVFDYSGNDTFIHPEPVGSLAANWLGIYDMSGNVHEYTYDPSGTSGGYAGGCYTSDAYHTRLGGRGSGSPVIMTEIIGFRIVRSFHF